MLLGEENRPEGAPPPLVIGPEGEQLIFLLGLPRSGTTLLSTLLGNHPAVAAPPEPWLMLALHQIGRVSIRHPANAQVLGTAVRQFAGDTAAETIIKDAGAEPGLRPAIRAAARTLYSSWLRREGRTHFLDKTPRYHLILNFLAEVFPKARFVWLLRDPFDVAASHLSTWGQDVARMIAEGHDDPAVIDLLVGLDELASFHARNGARVRLVRYEDLVIAPTAQLEGLLDHLGLSSSPDILGRMTDLAGFGRPDNAFGDSKIRSTQSPHNRSVGSWRSTLDGAQRQTLLDAIGSDTLARLGYGATAATLTAEGTRDNGAELAARHRVQARALLEARWDDVARISTFGASLPEDVQARVQAALASRGRENPPEPAGERPDRLADAVRRCAELEAALAQREREAAALRNSTSWRVTAPLRALSTWVRRPPRAPLN